MIKLSKRLQILAQLVPYGAKTADIGTDHAFLPCYLVEKRIAASAIGVDVRPGPCRAAQRTVAEEGLIDQVEIRQGNGLTALDPGEVEVTIIAGMGGGTIRDILEGSPQVVTGLKKLILQPMTGTEIVRSWLVRHGWTIEYEEIVPEDGRLYVVISASHEAGQVLDELEILYGPLLIKNRHPLLGMILEKELTGLQEILNQLAKSKTSESLKRTEELKERLTKTKELWQCLYAAKQS